MPPKAKSTAKSNKRKAKNGGAQTDKTSTRVLRKDPKRKRFSDEPDCSETPAKPKKPKGRPKKKAEASLDKDNRESDYELALEPGEMEDDFTDVSDEEGSGENSSKNANPAENEIASAGAVQPTRDSRENEGENLAHSIDKHVDAALDRYFKKQRSKKRRKKRKRRRESSSSSSSSDSGESSESSSESSQSDSSSDDSRERRRGRKRKREGKKRKSKKLAKGKAGNSTEPSESVSTVYTRGCKSPVGVIIEGSGDSSLDGGKIRSDIDTDEFIESLNTSRDRSTPDLAKRDGGYDQTDRREKRRSAERARDGRDERDDDRERYREKADSIIRDLHQNKADLVKPSGEISQFLLSSLIRDFKHFHLTSHVDKKLRESILNQDFTVDFRRLLPRSRAKQKSENRLQVEHKDGETYFVPAGEKEVRDIRDYKTWEVAFKIFMGIFNQQWPDRMQELLQYSHVIQVAAQNHPWENVYNYDIAFREIMSEQPNTHWGMISQQTWTLEMGENPNKSLSNTAQPVVGTSTKMGGGQGKPCWRFNKGRCTYGESCEYDHRCSHCGKRGHGRHECFKRQRVERGKDIKKERGK